MHEVLAVIACSEHPPFVHCTSSPQSCKYMSMFYDLPVNLVPTPVFGFVSPDNERAVRSGDTVPRSLRLC